MKKGTLLGDRLFVLLVVTLSLAGFAIFTSAALGFLARESSDVSHNILLQGGFGLGVGILALLGARFIPLAFLKRHAVLLFALTLLVTLAVFIPGVGLRAGGATRWLDLGPITVQPAEFLKIGFVLLLGAVLSTNSKQLSVPRKGLFPLIISIALPGAVLLAQPNTSTTFLLLLTGAAMYFVAGAPLRDFAILLLCGIVAFGALVAVRPYVLQRVITFLDPSAHSLGSGYQIQQSLISVGSGGLFGRGFGQSVGKFNYLPEPDGDSVFAVFAEETGFVGALLLLLAFLILSARGMMIAGHSADLFGGLIAFGFSFMILLQVFINVGAMIGIIPLTGLPLPFVSHGGTALIATLLMCGLVLNVAAHRKA